MGSTDVGSHGLNFIFEFKHVNSLKKTEENFLYYL